MPVNIVPNYHIDKDIINKKKIIKILKKEKTPLYIYDKNILKKYLNIMKTIKAKIFYSIKANPNNDIIKFFNKENGYFEAVSIGELKKVLKYSKNLSKTIFVGPAKKDFEIEFAIKNNIRMIIVESKNELKKIKDISKKLNKKVNILIRVNPNFNSGGIINMSGITQFGLSKDEVIKIVSQKYENITIKGLHFYLGTNILDNQNIIKNIELILKISNEIKFYHNFKIIDIGLGLGIAYYKDDKDLKINSLIKEINKKFKNSEFEFIVEIGRFLVAKSGIFIAKVIDIKTNFAKKFVLLDGGTNFFGLNSKFGGFRISPIKVLNNTNQKEVVTIVGNLCTSSDILANNISINKVQIGDYIVFYQAGAYCFSASAINFLSHNLPKEILV